MGTGEEERPFRLITRVPDVKRRTDALRAGRSGKARRGYPLCNLPRHQHDVEQKLSHGDYKAE